MEKDIYLNYVNDAIGVTSKRISQNSIFITINTVIFTLAAVEKVKFNEIVFIVLVVLILVNIQWYFIIQSFKKLSTIKFKLIHEMEESMNLSIYKKEHELLLSNNYQTLTSIDSALPWIFITASIVAIIIYI